MKQFLFQALLLWSSLRWSAFPEAVARRGDRVNYSWSLSTFCCCLCSCFAFASEPSQCEAEWGSHSQSVASQQLAVSFSRDTRNSVHCCFLLQLTYQRKSFTWCFCKAFCEICFHKLICSIWWYVVSRHLLMLFSSLLSCSLVFLLMSCQNNKSGTVQ